MTLDLSKLRTEDIFPFNSPLILLKRRRRKKLQYKKHFKYLFVSIYSFIFIRYVCGEKLNILLLLLFSVNINEAMDYIPFSISYL